MRVRTPSRGVDVATRLAGKVHETRGGGDAYVLLVYAYRACRLLHLTATVFCAFGARRLVSRGEFSWFVSSFVAHVATDAASGSALALAAAERETPRATVVRETTLNVESFAQNALEAIACGCIVVAGAVHSALVGYVDEADVFSSLVAGAACRFAFSKAPRARRASRTTTTTKTVAVDDTHTARASVSTSALVNEPGESVAVVGDGAETLFRRIVRGARDAGDVGVVVSPANEWTIPETNECLRSNALVFGDAVARVDALRHERLLETLEASLASSSRGLEYAPRRTRAAAEDVDIDPFLSTACDIGLERARRASARVLVAEHPFRELDDVVARRRRVATALTSARRSCVFTTTDACVLPFCTRIVVTRGDDVVFIGHWRELVRHRSTARACLSNVAFSPPARSLRLRRARLGSRLPSSSRDARVASSRDARIALAAFTCASVAPATATYALERWLDSKRSRDASGDDAALLVAAVGSFLIHVVARRAFTSSDVRAFARVGYVALASACMFPPSWRVVPAAAFFAALVAEGARPGRATRRLEREFAERLARAKRVASRVSRGLAQIRAAGCEEMYEDIGRSAELKARESLRRLLAARAASRMCVGGVVLTAFVFGASSLDAREDAARRGFLAFLALQTREAMVDVVERARRARDDAKRRSRGDETVALGRPRAPRRARSFA